MHFNHVDDLNNHYAMIGMGITLGNLPQYFDGMNEKGLAMAIAKRFMERNKFKKFKKRF